MELPDTIIHHIQSFLTPKQAARTALVSKAWRTAWSNRPTIDIDQSKHGGAYIETDVLIVFATNTFRRYEESNLTIHTFILCLKNGSYVRHGLAEQWTSKALKLGATDLTLRLNDRLNDRNTYPIPLTEVSRLENVVRLSLTCFKIDRLKVINCTGLKSLTLNDFSINPDQFFDILSRFPLIEYLSLSEVRRSHDIRVSSSVPIILHKLRSLVLSKFKPQIQMKKLFLDSLSSMFPNLKDLTLGLNLPTKKHLHESIRNISSSTIETLNLKYHESGDMPPKIDVSKIPRVKIDVPNIHKFTFEGLWIPKLCFSPTPVGDQWESHVSITNFGVMSTAWFRQLSQLFKKLKGWKIHLCLNFHFNVRFDYELGEIDGLNVFEVEDLTLDMKHLPSFSCYGVLDALFRTCHPKMITLGVNDDEMSDDDGGINNTRKNDLLICRSLEQGMQLKSMLHPTQLMYGLRDLEELDVQQLLDGVWKMQPLGCILDDADSTSQELKRRRFRLQFKWKLSSLDQYMRHSDDDADDDDDDEHIHRGFWRPYHEDEEYWSSDYTSDDDHMF